MGGLVLALIVGWIARNASSSGVPCKLVEIWSTEIRTNRNEPRIACEDRASEENVTGNYLIISFALSGDVSYVQRIDFGVDAGGQTG